MKRLIASLSLFFLIALRPQAAWAGELKLVISDLPQYTNKSDFRLYYTYLETEDKTAAVNLFVKKEGGDWRQSVDRNKSEVSGYFQIEGADLYDGQGKYFFYAKAASLDQTQKSLETEINYDTSAPNAPGEYRKERTNPTTFKLFWKNPNNDDFAKTYIYRSDQSFFSADSGTKIGEIGGGREEKMTFEDGSVEADKEYYYMIRAVDQAGNGSGLVGDTFESGEGPVTAPQGQEVGDQETLSGQEYKLSQTGGSILGEEEELNGTEGGKEEEGEGEEEAEGAGALGKRIPGWAWVLGIGALLAGNYFFRKQKGKS